MFGFIFKMHSPIFWPSSSWFCEICAIASNKYEPVLIISTIDVRIWISVRVGAKGIRVLTPRCQSSSYHSEDRHSCCWPILVSFDTEANRYDISKSGFGSDDLLALHIQRLYLSALRQFECFVVENRMWCTQNKAYLNNISVIDLHCA